MNIPRLDIMTLSILSVESIGPEDFWLDNEVIVDVSKTHQEVWKVLYHYDPTYGAHFLRRVKIRDQYGYGG